MIGIDQWAREEIERELFWACARGFCWGLLTAGIFSLLLVLLIAH